MLKPTLAERVYAEEIELGASPRDATLIAALVRCSDEYRDTWEAEYSERLREREKGRDEPSYCPCLTGCPECGGVPNHVAWLEALAEDQEQNG